MTLHENGADDVPLGEYPLSLDAMLEILSNQERRYLLEYLIEQSDDAGSPNDAVRYISKRLALYRGEQPNSEDIHVSLNHHHLPKLAEAGIIEYNIQKETIHYLGDDRLEKLYNLVKDFETR